MLYQPHTFPKGALTPALAAWRPAGPPQSSPANQLAPAGPAAAEPSVLTDSHEKAAGLSSGEDHLHSPAQGSRSSMVDEAPAQHVPSNARESQGQACLRLWIHGAARKETYAALQEACRVYGVSLISRCTWHCCHCAFLLGYLCNCAKPLPCLGSGTFPLSDAPELLKSAEGPLHVGNPSTLSRSGMYCFALLRGATQSLSFGSVYHPRSFITCTRRKVDAAT